MPRPPKRKKRPTPLHGTHHPARLLSGKDVAAMTEENVPTEELDLDLDDEAELPGSPDRSEQ